VAWSKSSFGAGNAPDQRPSSTSGGSLSHPSDAMITTHQRNACRGSYENEFTDAAPEWYTVAVGDLRMAFGQRHLR